MTMEDKARNGEFRELTPAEIAKGVSGFRKSMGWKQITLAHEAGVTERTIQRLEAGDKVDEETLRRVAKGLRLRENALIGPRYIPTPEEALANAEHTLKDFMSDWAVADVHPLSSIQDFGAILGAHAHVVDDRQVNAAMAETIAGFKDCLQDWMDVYDDMTESDKLQARQEMFKVVKEIESEGYTARFGVCTTDDRFNVAVIMFVDTKDWHRCGLTQMIVPRRLDQWMRGVRWPAGA